jgi:fucose permease
MVWGLAIASAGLTIAGIGATLPSFAVAFVGLLVFGGTSGMTDVAMNVSGAANERALGRAIMPVFHAFFSFGTMVGAGLGALAEFLRIPIAIHFGTIAVLVIATGLVARRYIQPDQPTHDHDGPIAADDHSLTWRGRLAIWRDARTLLIGLIVLAAAFAEGSANDWLAIASVDGHHVPNATGAIIFGIFVTAMTGGRLGGIFLLDRYGRVVVLRATFLLAAVGLVVFIFVPIVPIAVAGAVLWGFGASLGFPIGMSAAADDPKTAAARVSAVATIGYFAFLVGPPVIGLLGQYFGVIHGLLVVLVLTAIGALVSGAAREPRGPRRPAETSTNNFDDPQVL